MEHAKDEDIEKNMWQAQTSFRNFIHEYAKEMYQRMFCNLGIRRSSRLIWFKMIIDNFLDCSTIDWPE